MEEGIPNIFQQTSLTCFKETWGANIDFIVLGSIELFVVLDEAQETPDRDVFFFCGCYYMER